MASPLNELKKSLWSYLQSLSERIEVLRLEGWSATWLRGQHAFCRSEIAYWKEVSSEFNKKGEK